MACSRQHPEVQGDTSEVCVVRLSVVHTLRSPKALALAIMQLKRRKILGPGRALTKERIRADCAREWQPEVELLPRVAILAIIVHLSSSLTTMGDMASERRSALEDDALRVVNMRQHHTADKVDVRVIEIFASFRWSPCAAVPLLNVECGWTSVTAALNPSMVWIWILFGRTKRFEGCTIYLWVTAAAHPKACKHMIAQPVPSRIILNHCMVSQLAKRHTERSCFPLVSFIFFAGHNLNRRELAHGHN